MMKKNAITIKNVWKSYNKHFFSGKINKKSQFNVLEDINLEIKKSDCIGIVGDNGSGKSTLLKLIAGILEPSLGRVEVDGKIAAVIELGNTLSTYQTGYENIFLYGSILGMSRKKILAELDKIVEFAGLGRYLNEPISIYSTGMIARLAFSIAIHSDCNIILIDEALSVGDTDFKIKSLNKLRKLKKTHTIVITSHDTNLIYQICDYAVSIRDKRIVHKNNQQLFFLLKKLPKGKIFKCEAVSDSMWPFIKRGDVVQIKKLPFSKILANDVVAFKLKNFDDIIIHRVLTINHKNKKRVLLTKGDSALNNDAWEVSEEEYLGKVEKILRNSHN